MVASTSDRALAAFRRLLADAPSGPQAKVDALVALSQRTVYVATWTEDGEDYRTLVNSNGQNALPLFTDEHELQVAAKRFGWLDADGRVPHREVGARSALRHALSRGIGFVVVDIMADYSLEAGQREIQPLVASRHRSDSSGPFAGVGRISSSMMQAVRVTPSGGVPRPMTPEDGMKPPTVGGGPSPERAAAPPPEAPPPADANFGGAQSGSVQIVQIIEPPQDVLLDALEDLLRDYPEVEWAAYCYASRGPASAQPAVGVMVDSSFRERIGEIARGIQRTGNATGASLDVVFLDTPALMREARANGTLFFPWRR